MLNDNLSVTRLTEQLADYNGYVTKIERTLSDEFTGHTYFSDLETVADLRRAGKDNLIERFPQIGKRPFNWLFHQLEGEA